MKCRCGASIKKGPAIEIFDHRPHIVSVFRQLSEARQRTTRYAGAHHKHANLKYKFGNRHFWSEGYYVSTVGTNEAGIKKYIEDQEKHDIAMDKLSVREYKDPFKG